MDELTRIDFESDANLYDCRTCRSMKLNQDHRICFLDLKESICRRDDGLLAVLSPVSVSQHLNHATDELVELRRWSDCSGKGKEVCFIPCIGPAEREAIAAEIDAKQYGNDLLRTDRKIRNSFRIIRSERARLEAKRHKERIRKRDA